MSEAAVETPGPPETSPLRIGAALGGVVLSAVVIFGLGVMVGKRVAESGPAIAPPPSALPTETLAPRPAVEAPAAAIPPERLTFYDRLSGVAPPPPLPLPEGQAPAQAGESPASAPAPAAAAAPSSALARPAAIPAASRETPVAAQEKPAPQPQPQAKTAPPAAKADAEAQIRKLAGKGRFAVQVAAVNDRATAEETAARVKRQGFEVVTVMASVKGKVWYRVRVNSFPSSQAATEAAAIFRSAYGYDAIPVQN